MYNNILIPIDLDHEEGTQKSFSAARRLAGETAKLTVVHIMEDVPGYVRGQISEDALEDRYSAAEQSLKNIAGDLEGAKTKLLSGHAAQAIVNLAEENKIDCIILSSHRQGMERFFIGSTASRVVSHTVCTVVVIR